MPASSAMLITAELGRIVAVSSSNQTTSASRLNWLITQPTPTLSALKQNGLLSVSQCVTKQKLENNVLLSVFRTAQCAVKQTFFTELVFL